MEQELRNQMLAVVQAGPVFGADSLALLLRGVITVCVRMLRESIDEPEERQHVTQQVLRLYDEIIVARFPAAAAYRATIEAVVPMVLLMIATQGKQ